MSTIAELAEDRDRRRRLRRRPQAAAADEEGRRLSRARARRSDRPDRGAYLERRRAARHPLRGGRCGARARPGRALRRPPPARAALARGGGSGSGGAGAADAPRRRRAGRVPRVPRRRGLACRVWREVVGRVLGDDELRAAMRALPAADSHHSYAGGLLEHTVGVATLARETAQLHPRLRSDLLLAAALLHDRRAGARATSRPLVPRRPRRAGCSDTCTWACG